MKRRHRSIALGIIFLGVGVLVSSIFPPEFIAAVIAIAVVILGIICLKR